MPKHIHQILRKFPPTISLTVIKKNNEMNKLKPSDENKLQLPSLKNYSPLHHHLHQAWQCHLLSGSLL